MCVCLCVDVHVCAFTYVYVLVCVCMCTCICVCVLVYMCVPACLHMCMYMYVFVNNSEYPTEYTQHLCYDTFINCFQHNNIFTIIKKGVELKWEKKMMMEVVRF